MGKIFSAIINRNEEFLLKNNAFSYKFETESKILETPKILAEGETSLEREIIEYLKNENVEIYTP